MSQAVLKAVVTGILITGIAFSASAKTTKKPHAKMPAAAAAAKADQNAFTRGMEKPLAGNFTSVANNNVRCFSVVECRQKGSDLKTAWQANNTSDFAPRDYPARCYVLSEGGKYTYSAAACR